MDRDVDGEVGVFDIDVGTCPSRLPQPVAHRILNLQGCECRVLELVVGPMCVHRYRGALPDLVFPSQGIDTLIELFGACGTHTPDHELHAGRDPRPETGPIGIDESSRRRHAAHLRADPAQAKRTQLVCEHVLESRGTAHKELERVLPHRLLPLVGMALCIDFVLERIAHGDSCVGLRLGS